MPTTASEETTVPRRPVLARDTAMRLAATEYDRFLDQLRALRPEEWSARTECPAWDVRELATHVLGMAEMSASLRVQLHQTRASQRAAQGSGSPLIDELTALQVRERADLTPQQVVAAFAKIGPRAARGRRRVPGFVRSRTMPGEQPTGPDAPTEPWTFGYLIDVVLTRDTWMHRVDIARATGREPVLTAEHDGVLVDDVVREWGARHGEPCTLVLAGPAGGSWAFGDGPELSADAVDFCRSVSGRDVLPGLLGTPVPF